MYVLLLYIWYFSGFQTVQGDLEVTDNIVVETPGIHVSSESTSNL